MGREAITVSRSAFGTSEEFSPGAVYHLMSRGDQREDIFLCDVILGKSQASFGLGAHGQSAGRTWNCRGHTGRSAPV